MNSNPIRVLVWGPGGLGNICIREVLRMAEFELAGVLAYSAKKNGVDAATLIGLDAPAGVSATRPRPVVSQRSIQASSPERAALQPGVPKRTQQTQHKQPADGSCALRIPNRGVGRSPGLARADPSRLALWRLTFDTWRRRPTERPPQALGRGQRLAGRTERPVPAEVPGPQCRPRAVSAANRPGQPLTPPPGCEPAPAW